MISDTDSLWLAYFRAANDQVAIVRFAGVIDVHLWPINDEGLGRHPYAQVGLKFYAFNEITGSRETQQWSALRARHWVVTFKDQTLDVVARTGEVVADRVDAPTPMAALVSFIRDGANQQQGAADRANPRAG